MPGLVFLLPTQTLRSISLYCLLRFLSLHKHSFFWPDQSLNPERYMLMLRCSEGFMYLFSSPLFKAFSLMLMFSPYHVAIRLCLATGQKCACMWICVCLFSVLSLKRDTFSVCPHEARAVWPIHSFLFLKSFLSQDDYSQNAVVYMPALYVVLPLCYKDTTRNGEEDMSIITNTESSVVRRCCCCCCCVTWLS